LKVKDVAGKVCLMIPNNGTVVPSDFSFGYIDSLRSFDVVDVWRCGSVCEAKAVLDKHMRNRDYGLIDDRNYCFLRGVCLDITVTGIPPSWTSPALNEWFVSKLRSDPEWVSPSKEPLGVLLMDFVDDPNLISQLFSLCKERSL
jgi:hypothetical protein